MDYRTARRLMPALTIALVTVAVTSAGASSTATWTAVSTPNVGALPNALNGVSALSSTSAWAVGHWYDNSTASYRTLIERWNGSSWGVVPSQNTATGYSELWDVAAVSATDAWAVGWSRDPNLGTSTALVERWNGSAWKLVPVPATGTNYASLLSVAASSSSDVWAVGGSVSLHWNGSAWKSMPIASTQSGGLNAVATLGPTDAWAVGSFVPVAGKPRTDKTLVEHWNGSSWTVVPSPNAAGSATNVLHGVAALGPSDVWAVGWYYPTGSQVAETLIEHWNGSSWTVVPSPSSGTNRTVLWDVTALSATDLWAAGYADDPSLGLRTVVEHWNGSTWTINPTPNPGVLPRLQAIASAAPGTVWAVGIKGNGSTDRTLALRTTQG